MWLIGRFEYNSPFLITHDEIRQLTYSLFDPKGCNSICVEIYLNNKHCSRPEHQLPVSHQGQGCWERSRPFVLHMSHVLVDSFTILLFIWEPISILRNKMANLSHEEQLKLISDLEIEMMADMYNRWDACSSRAIIGCLPLVSSLLEKSWWAEASLCGAWRELGWSLLHS